MKIFQTYYSDDQKPHLIDGLNHINVSSIVKDKLEYDVFKHLRPEGDFGVISWKFQKKTLLTDWQDKVHEKLKTHDAVIINPFPAIESLVWNCWENHPTLLPFANVDSEAMQKHAVFCSYIFAKKAWWDEYFAFMDAQIAKIPKEVYTLSAGYFRNKDISCVPFLIERWLNYCLNGAYLWEYDKEHFRKKYGLTDFFGLKERKGTLFWILQKSRFNFNNVASLDDPE